MTFTIIDADQRSEEWRLARCGRLTGSRASDVLATIKSGEAAARRDYRMQLVVERLTGRPQDSDFINDAMQWGIDMEPMALAAYEVLTGNVATKTGFLSHTSLMVGCSVDGSIDHFTGLLELKCPKSATHYRYLREGTMPADHLPQVLHNLWVTGAQWCDFLSYDPRFPDGMRTMLVRVERDQRAIDEYAAKAIAFLEEVERDVSVALGWRVLAASA